MILRNPQFLFLLALLPIIVALWYFSRKRVLLPAMLLRLGIVAMLVLALADPIIGARPISNSQSPVILAIDQSDSLGDAGRAALRERAAALAAAQTQPVSLFYFGGANVPVPYESAASGTHTLPAPDENLRPDATNLAAALRLARSMAAPGSRVMLLSDGEATAGNVLREAQALGVAGIPVDTVVYTPTVEAEVWLQSIEMPRTLREGEQFELEVVIGSTSETQAQLQLLVGASESTQSSVALRPGENRFRYTNTAGKTGMLNVYAGIESQGDMLAQNNVTSATALVAPAPQVLLVEGEPASARLLQQALQPLSMNTDLIAPNRLPTRLSDLERYESIVLINVAADQLTLDQMASLREFVRSEGRGLVVAGGRSSFTLGAYKDTPLEEALPVLMQPPERGERPDVTMLLIIDQSASMGPDMGDSKFNMAKEAAILATESLRDSDRIGVITFDISPRWVVDFQQVGQGLSIGDIQDKISRIPLGGGTDILSALELATPTMLQQPGKTRHIVLLTDGRSFTTNRQAYRVLTEQMRANNVTLSTIAIGADSDIELLKELAQDGAGRYHFADQPSDIPRLTLRESEILRTEPQIEGEFQAELMMAHPALRGFAANSIPALQGYAATTAKAEAEVILRSPEEDPVLAVWQYGLGRAVAWTPSIEAPWAQSWANWTEYGQFWAQIIRYTLPEPDSGPLQVRVTRSEGDTAGNATISADAILGGQPLDLADVNAEITMPDGSARVLPLHQVAPGRYASSVVLPSEGPYAISVHAIRDEQQANTQIGYVRSYSEEYLPAQARSSATVHGAALLAQISATSGGKVMDRIEGQPTSRPDASRPSTDTGAIALWPWILGLALILWVIEIAFRRGWLRRV